MLYWQVNKLLIHFSIFFYHWLVLNLEVGLDYSSSLSTIMKAIEDKMSKISFEVYVES